MIERKAGDTAIQFSLGEGLNIAQMPPPEDVLREGGILALVWGTVEPDIRVQLRRPNTATLGDLAASVHASTSGVYFLLLYDESSQEIAFFVDLFSCKKVFFFQCGNTLYFSTNLVRLVAAGIARPEVDLATVATFLMYDYVPTNHTLLRGVRSLGAFTWYRFKNGVVAESEVWPFSPVVASGDYREIVKETFERFESAFVSGSRNMDSLIVPVSGGSDSRLLLGLALRHRRHKVSTFTFGQPGTLDYEIGTGLTKKLKLDHTSYAIGRDFYHDHIVPSTPFLNGLTNHVLAPSNFLSQRFRSTPGQGVLSGYIGDLVIGWKKGTIPVLRHAGVRYPWAKQFSLDTVLDILPGAREQILERLAELQSKLEACCADDEITVNSWYYRIRVATFTAVGLFSEQDEEFRFLTPFVNIEFLRWMFSIPNTIKADPNFYRDLVGFNPEIAALFKFPLKNLNGEAHFHGPLANALSTARYAWRAFRHGVRPKQNFAHYEGFYPHGFVTRESFKDSTLSEIFNEPALLKLHGPMPYAQKMLLLSLRLHLLGLLDPGKASCSRNQANSFYEEC